MQIKFKYCDVKKDLTEVIFYFLIDSIYLKAEKLSLNNKIRELDAEIASFKTKCDNLEQEIEAIKKFHKDEIDTANMKYREEHDGLIKKLEDLEAANSELLSQADTLRTTLEEKESARDEIASLKTSIAILEKEKTAANELVKACRSDEEANGVKHQEEHDALTKKLEDLEASNRRQEAVVKATIEELEAAKEAVELKYSAEIASLKISVDRLEKEKTAIRESIEKSKANEVDALAVKYQEEQNVLIRRLEELETANRRQEEVVKATIEQLERDKADAEARYSQEIDLLKTSVDRLGLEKAAMKVEMESSMGSEVAALNLRHQEEQGAFSKRLEEMETANLELQKQIASLHGRLEQAGTVESERLDLQEAIRQHEGANETLKGCVEELQREKRILEERAERLQAEFEAKLEGLTDKSELERLSQVHQVKHDNLTHTIETLEAERARIQGNLEANQAESDGLRRELEEAAARHAEEVNRLGEELEKANAAKAENLRLFEEVREKHASDMASFEPKVSKLEECLLEVLNLSVKMQGLEASLAEKETEVERLVREKEHAGRQLARAEAEVSGSGEAGDSSEKIS